MKEIETVSGDPSTYCIRCNTKTTDETGSVTPCNHLEYVGTGEGAEFSIYEPVEEPDDIDDWKEYDAQIDEFRKKLDDEHLCVHITTPAPSFETFSVIYNLGARTRNVDDSHVTDVKKHETSQRKPHGGKDVREREKIETLKELRLQLGDEDFRESLGSDADEFLSRDSKYYDSETLDKMK